MTPGKEMPRWPGLVLNNAGRVGSSMQRKGGEGERAHRGRCREEGRGGRERCVGNSDACGSDDVSASVSDRESTRLATHHTPVTLYHDSEIPPLRRSAKMRLPQTLHDFVRRPPIGGRLAVVCVTVVSELSCP